MIGRRSFLLGGVLTVAGLAAARAQPRVGGPVWAARHDGGGVVLVVGGMHSLRAEDSWLRKDTVELLSNADAVFLETLQRRVGLGEVERSRLMVVPAAKAMSKQLAPEPAARFRQQIAD